MALPIKHSEPPPGHPKHNEENNLREVFKAWGRMAVKFATHNIDRDELTMEVALWQAIAADQLPSNNPQRHDNSELQYKLSTGKWHLGWAMVYRKPRHAGGQAQQQAPIYPCHTDATK